MTALEPVTCNRLGALSPKLAHGFFTRKGGASSGIYEGLNTGLGSRDDRETVLANRALVSRHLGAPATFIATPHQVHSSDVITVREAWKDGERPVADAVVTDVPGLALGVLTADCGPVLFSNATGSIVGAAHAGWKGATGGILENTIDAIENLGANRGTIIATLGPTISQSSYEVGPEFVERLISLESGNARYLVPSGKPAHALFDLPAYILARLAASGVEARWTGQ